MPELRLRRNRASLACVTTCREQVSVSIEFLYREALVDEGSAGCVTASFRSQLALLDPNLRGPKPQPAYPMDYRCAQLAVLGANLIFPRLPPTPASRKSRGSDQWRDDIDLLWWDCYSGGHSPFFRESGSEISDVVFGSTSEEEDEGGSHSPGLRYRTLEERMEDRGWRWVGGQLTSTRGETRDEGEESSSSERVSCGNESECGGSAGRGHVNGRDNSDSGSGIPIPEPSSRPPLLACAHPGPLRTEEPLGPPPPLP